VIISAVIVLIAFIISYIINIDRSDNSWSFEKSPHEISNQFNPKFFISRIDNPKKCFIKPKRLILILLPTTLTSIICVLIINSRDYIKETVLHSKQLFEFCLLYENNSYHHLLTLPIALVIILVIVFNQTRIEYYKFNKEKFSIFIPIPFNPFSKINRFDTMILCGIISHEILQIIEEIFRKTIQFRLLTINGPLFDLIRQIGFVIIIGLRYYPIYSVIEMSNVNILYYALCAFYMWLELILRIFEQVFCVNIHPFIRMWQQFQRWNGKYQTSSMISTTTMFMPEYEDGRAGGFRERFHRMKDRFSFRGTRSTSVSTIQVRELSQLRR
jgi:hypothetical protein